MSTRLDKKLRSAATSLIGRYGQTPVSYLSASAGAFSAATDSREVTFTEIVVPGEFAEVEVIASGVESFRDSTVVPGEVYRYRVKQTDDLSASEFSNIA